MNKKYVSGLIIKVVKIIKDFSLLCPNEKETRIALRDNESGLEKLSQRLLSITKTKRLILRCSP